MMSERGISVDPPTRFTVGGFAMAYVELQRLALMVASGEHGMVTFYALAGHRGNKSFGLDSLVPRRMRSRRVAGAE